uniref:Uncharacterized protein n=1 Tax=Arundo donax TaxID=35708 RepID=A0A0A8YTZ0_ARUDO
MLMTSRKKLLRMIVSSACRELPLPPDIVGQKEYKDRILDYIKQ